eukprot:gene2026-3937_t
MASLVDSTCLNEFGSKVDMNLLIFPPVSHNLEKILRDISSTGTINCEWEVLRKLIAAQLVKALVQFRDKKGFIGPITETFDSRSKIILHLLQRFDNPPFTIQRLVELILDPFSQYSSTYKFMNGLERILSVTSTIDTSSDENQLMDVHN